MYSAGESADKIAAILWEAAGLHSDQLEQLMAGQLDPKDLDMSTSPAGGSLWRLARALHHWAGTAPPQPAGADTAASAGLRRAQAILAVAEAAVKVDPVDFAAHKWLGITLNQAGTLEGTSAKIKASYEVRRHWQRAAELNPNDPTTQHLLGAWCEGCASLSWLERQAASVIFGTPPTSTHEEALEHFEAAERLQPRFWIENLVCVAEVSSKLGRRSRAVAAAREALGLEASDADDRAGHERARKVLKALGEAE